MSKLIFISTNFVKLAHFRHIAKRFGIEIEFFRRKTFLASYCEPQIGNRAQLLSRSFDSALNQWRKSGLQLGRTLFFIEDTSVRIDALSTESEIPGVDVKYWMRTKTFDDLNMELRALGNNRAASVRSDIVVSLPVDTEQSQNIPRYIVFTGQVNGSIVAAELSYQSNLVYPWLDSKSFSKWFVPAGESKPLGSLPIEVADRYDFRRAAFQQLMFWLRGALPATFPGNPPGEQLELALRSTTLEGVIICGPSCAGKTTLAECIRGTLGWYHFEASDFMCRAMHERNGVNSDHFIPDFAEQALLHEPDIVSSQIKAKILARPGLPFVITGFRAPEEVSDFLSGQLKHSNILLLYLDADRSIRYQRYLDRGRDIARSEESFRRRDLQQERMGLARMRGELIMRPLRNDSTKSDLYAAFKQVIHKFQVPVRVETLGIRDVPAEASRHPLETVILKALFTKVESKEYFTTTEIAKIINETQIDMEAQRSKDNVSRYFNQDYYAFYEVLVYGSKRRYRLSNTGRSEALFVSGLLRASLV